MLWLALASGDVDRVVVASAECTTEVSMNMAKGAIIPKGTLFEIPNSGYMEDSNSYNSMYMGNFRGCGTSERVDIQSVKVIEKQGNRVTLAVKYANVALGKMVKSSETRTGACAYAMTLADTSLAPALEAQYPGYNTPLIQIGCPENQDCVLEYEIFAACVALPVTSTPTNSPSPTSTTSTQTYTPAPTSMLATSTQQTALAKSRAGKSALASDYFAQGVTVVASLVAVGIAMRLRAQHNELEVAGE